MQVFTISLARVSVPLALDSLYRPLRVPGLVHAESLTLMELGAPIVSHKRLQLRQLITFAAWESEDAIDEFLTSTPLGHAVNSGWHLRMMFLRRWGSVKALEGLPEEVEPFDPAAPVAAFTLARMRLPEVPRFIRWGRPVEALVRDDPHSTFALAAIRHPNTVATFSIWNSQQDMVNMVRGHGSQPDPKRHIRAMQERNRRDFHHEFAVLRFRPLAEHGQWNGMSSLLPAESGRHHMSNHSGTAKGNVST